MITAHPRGRRRPRNRTTDALAINRLPHYDSLVVRCILNLLVLRNVHGHIAHVAIKSGLSVNIHDIEDGGLGIQEHLVVGMAGVARVVIVTVFIVAVAIISGLPSTPSSPLRLAAFLWFREGIALRAFVNTVLNAKAPSALAHTFRVLRASDAPPRGALAPAKTTAELVVLAIVRE